jgi:Fur family peroxide stress response transcriptional regulator
MSPEKLRFFKEACRRAGLKLTHQRLEILRELALSNDHPSAEVLHSRLTKRIPTLSLDTVYRTLATFNQYGLAQKVETAESQARFEIVHERHHHLICRHCHEIVDFHWPSIDDLALPETVGVWGRIDSRNAVIYGVCRKCSLKTSATDKTKG